MKSDNVGTPVGFLVPADGVGPTLFLHTQSVVVVYKDGFRDQLEMPLELLRLEVFGKKIELFAVPGKGMYRGANAAIRLVGVSVRIWDLTSNATTKIGRSKVPADRLGGNGTRVQSGVPIFFGSKRYFFLRLPKV